MSGEGREIMRKREWERDNKLEKIKAQLDT